MHLSEFDLISLRAEDENAVLIGWIVLHLALF